MSIEDIHNVSQRYFGRDVPPEAPVVPKTTLEEVFQPVSLPESINIPPNFGQIERNFGGSVELEGIHHVAQSFKRGSHFVCRKAVLRETITYLHDVKGLSWAQISKILPSDIKNNKLLWTTKKWPGKHEKIVQDKVMLNTVIGTIDRHLDDKCPAIVYVKHLTGVHVIGVKGRRELPDHTIEYTFDDPGSGNDEFKTGRLIYDPVHGTCTKQGDGMHGNVYHRQYDLLGVYDYHTKMEEVLKGEGPRS